MQAQNIPFRRARCVLAALGFQLSLGLAFLLSLLAPRAPAAVRYVDANCINATPPYTNWATAARIIQDAVDAAVAGDEVVVTNGNYATGWGTIDGVTLNRVAVDKLLSIRSVNGPQFTIIRGGGPCVYLIDSASLSGFTITQGRNPFVTGDITYAYGGGAYGGTLNNCTLINNSVSVTNNGSTFLFAGGGGAAYCTLSNCTLSGNSVSATVFGTADASAEGGGAAYCTLNNCTLSGNWVSASRASSLPGTFADANGGGASQCTVNNCLLTGNSVSATSRFGGGHHFALGGGTYGGTVSNCTLTGNRAFSDEFGGLAVGGAFGDALNTCILFSNAPDGDGGSPGSLVGNNWFGDPLFVDTNGWANLRLQSNSPCINAGNNTYALGSTDLDGNPRIAGGTVDIGAYEFQSPVSQISYAWLQQYGLPINSSTDTADPDGDGVGNYHEWLAGTNPTNSLSSPAQLTITPSGIPPSGIILTWSSKAVGFTLQSTTNLFSPAAWVTNSPAPVVVNGLNTVTNSLSGPQKFYRLIQ